MPYKEDPQMVAAIAALQQGKYDLIVLDFDHTLLRANSTELFLQYARPVWLQNLVAKVLKRVLSRPWKWTRNLRRYKDEIRCSIMILLTPWNLVRWRQHAPTLSNLLDDDMFEAAAQDGRKVAVVTCGLKEIIQPMLGHRLSRCTLIASEIHRPWGYVRRKGKVTLLSQAVGGLSGKQAISISDSLEDKELLEATEGYLIDARYPSLPGS